MKNVLLIIAFFAPTIVLFSQDTLCFWNEETLAVKVQEISPRKLKYTVSNEPQATTFIVPKWMISSCKINGDDVELRRGVNPRSTARNSISLDFLDFMNKNLSLNYERFVGASNTISLNQMISVGLNRDFPGFVFGQPVHYGTFGWNLLSVQTGAQFYTPNKTRFRFFLSPAIGYNLRKTIDTYPAIMEVTNFDVYGNLVVSYTYPYAAYSSYKVSHFMSYSLDGGVRFFIQPCLGIQASVGFTVYDNLESVRSFGYNNAELSLLYTF